MRTAILTLIAALAAAPALAEGDAAEGENTFKKCRSCHAIVADNGEGETIFKGGKTGPNLWGLPGRAAGTYPDYNYGDGLIAAGEKGLVWTEEVFVAYVADPKGYLSEYLGDSAKTKMSFKLKKGAEDVWAYISSVSPAPETAPATQ